MNGAVLRVIALNELRLRLRRMSTLVVLLTVVALSWLVIADPASGNTLVAVNDHRALYTSQTLAFGSATLASLLLGMASFYLVRGRVAEEMQSGMGAVIGATRAGNGVLALGRWLGALGYLLALILAYLCATLALHGLRGEGPLQLLVYLQTYALILLPMVCFGASCAVLFDHFGPLVGRTGDVLYFVLWCAQFSVNAAMADAQGPQWPAMFDFSGLATSLSALRQHFDTKYLAIGATTFDPALAPVILPAELWSTRDWGMRAVTLLLAMLPLLPAAWLFHRYSPDRVRAGSARRSRLRALGQWLLRPCAWLARPLPALALKVPGFAGSVLAEAALVLRMSPAAVLVLCAGCAAALLAESSALGAVLAGAMACWGVIVSGIAPRDWQQGADALTAALPGGALRRYLRQWCATLVLALPAAGVVALRWWLQGMGLRALAAVVGVLALASAAALMGGLTRGSRLFLALFLFALFAALNAVTLAPLDMVGFNGAATAASIAGWALAGALAWGGGLYAASCCNR